MYAKLINGVLQYAPKNFLTESGQYIANFNKNEDLMIKYGFKEVIDVRPDFDAKTQRPKIKGYRENESAIYIEYEVKNVFNPAPVKTYAEKKVSRTFPYKKEEINNDDNKNE